jgi:hypothetical protein
MSTDQIIIDFNDTLLTFVENLASVCPNTLIADNKTTIKNVLNKKENKRKSIDLFVAKVLIYKPMIDEGNEDFFLKKSFDDDVKGVDGGDMISSKIFEFKDIWKNLNAENKSFVIQYMQVLCLLAQNYFVELDSITN